MTYASFSYNFRFRNLYPGSLSINLSTTQKNSLQARTIRIHPSPLSLTSETSKRTNSESTTFPEMLSPYCPPPTHPQPAPPCSTHANPKCNQNKPNHHLTPAITASCNYTYPSTLARTTNKNATILRPRSHSHPLYHPHPIPLPSPTQQATPPPKLHAYSCDHARCCG